MALDASTSLPRNTHILSNLPASCCALGYTRKGKYHLGEYCKEAIRELIRYLRRDDADHTARRYLGKAKILVLDLLPIVKHYYEDYELFDLILRLLVNLTNPVLLLYNEELPSDPVSRRCYLQIISQLQVYKEAFTDEAIWAVLVDKLTTILNMDASERSEEVGMVAERILVLTRNILQVPADQAEERPDSDANIHDQVLWALRQSGMTDLILYTSSSENEQAYCMHILEIICLMLREQTASELAQSQAERSFVERSKDVEELMSSLEQEKATKHNKMKTSLVTRHPRFGGSFVVRNVKGVGDNDIIVHKPYKDTDKVPHAVKKQKSKVRKNEMPLKDSDATRRSPYGIRLFLQKFCNEFLSGAYNTLMRYVKGCLSRRIAQPNDESFYLWAMKFFMEFNRTAKNEIKLVSETMNVSCFYWVITQMEHCHGMLKSDKAKLLFWSRRTHLALRAYLELLNTLVSMEVSSDKTIRQSARVIQGNLFYVVEHREALLWLLNSFDESKMSRAYLQDMIETLHVFTKLLERFCKTERGLVVQTKRVKKRRKTKKSTPAPAKPPEKVASNEELWDEVAPQLSVVLSSGVIPEDVVPFDAASDREIDEQKVDAMRKIHTLLKHHQYEEAVGLLRASREVWQDNDIFGRSNADPEEELTTLREVFFADIAQDLEVAANAESGQLNEEQNREEEEEEEEEFDDEEDEEGVPVYNEKEFDFRSFLNRLVSSHAIKPASLLLQSFETNPKFINHCVAKLFHRIAWEAKSYAVLFQASIFIQFRKILASPRPEHQELAKLAKFVVGKFVEVAQKNKLAFVELLPWKNTKQAYDIESGYEEMNQPSGASKKMWREEEEDELRRLHSEYMRDEPGDDIIDWILERLINKNRTKAGVRKKLRELFLILPSGKNSKPPKDWSEAEICELTQLYGKYKDSNDPMDHILMGLTVKRGKIKVLDKLLELGLVSDRKELHKKRRSNVRRGGNNHSSSDDSDSDTGNRNKKKDKNKTEQKDRAALKRAQRKGPASKGQVVSTLLQVVEADMRAALQWLLESLKEAASDLEAEDNADASEGIPLLPVEEDAVAAMDEPLFHRLLQNLGISPPFDEQEVYWRIPEDLSPNVIREKVELLQSALDGTLSRDEIEEELQLSEGEHDSLEEGNQSASTSRKPKEISRKSNGGRFHLSDSSSDDESLFASLRRKPLEESQTKPAENGNSSRKSRFNSDSESETEDQPKKKKQRAKPNAAASSSKKRNKTLLGSDSETEPQKKKKKSKKTVPETSDSNSVQLSSQAGKKSKKRINISLLESDSEEERVSQSNRGDENDINSGNLSPVPASKKPILLDSDSDGEQRTQVQAKKKKAVLSDSDEEDVPTQRRMITLSDSDDNVDLLGNANDKKNGKRVLSSSDEETAVLKKRAIELDD